MRFFAVKLHTAFCTFLEDQQLAVEDDGFCSFDFEEVGHTPIINELYFDENSGADCVIWPRKH
jgi:hypothetical protein